MESIRKSNGFATGAAGVFLEVDRLPRIGYGKITLEAPG
jgi:hypothetical protein